MIKNYFKTAVRAFRKNNVTTCINVPGLSIGISAALVIFVLVAYDYGFDKFQPDRNRIYCIVSEGKGGRIRERRANPVDSLRME